MLGWFACKICISFLTVTESSDGGMGKQPKNPYKVAYILYCNQVNDLTVKKGTPSICQGLHDTFQ